mmetsp:Transcript_4731/g.11626  ORF Transcript_4731/g.11626 Transcript_4731/m.11626 type:complete len:367 (-) Transcript_4731:547-1647(-)
MSRSISRLTFRPSVGCRPSPVVSSRPADASAGKREQVVMAASFGCGCSCSSFLSRPSNSTSSDVSGNFSLGGSAGGLAVFIFNVFNIAAGLFSSSSWRSQSGSGDAGAAVSSRPDPGTGTGPTATNPSFLPAVENIGFGSNSCPGWNSFSVLFSAFSTAERVFANVFSSFAFRLACFFSTFRGSFAASFAAFSRCFFAFFSLFFDFRHEKNRASASPTPRAPPATRSPLSSMFSSVTRLANSKCSFVPTSRLDFFRSSAFAFSSSASRAGGASGKTPAATTAVSSRTSAPAGSCFLPGKSRRGPGFAAATDNPDPPSPAPAALPGGPTTPCRSNLAEYTATLTFREKRHSDFARSNRVRTKLDFFR